MKKKYEVLSPVDHDKVRYEIGKSIDLEDKDAAGLLALNVIKLAEVSAAPSAPADEAELLTAITDAIGKLDVNDKALWSKGGSPKTEAIAAVTGWPVSAAYRDTAWAQINAAQ
jgi:hypothetical protein